MSRLLLVACAACLAAVQGCSRQSAGELGRGRPAERASSAETRAMAERQAMVSGQIEARGMRDERVLQAMRTVPRDRFVPDSVAAYAYADSPLPIGRGQTISQPYVVARMIELLQLQGKERVLEVGSGSGYAAAVLSLVAAEVYGIELEEELHARSLATIQALGYANVHLRWGDGFLGWPEAAPFDAILVSCAVEDVPPPLWEQLKPGGRLLYPKGAAGEIQQLSLVTKTATGRRERHLELVSFVPMRRAP